MVMPAMRHGRDDLFNMCRRCDRSSAGPFAKGTDADDGVATMRETSGVIGAAGC